VNTALATTQKGVQQEDTHALNPVASGEQITQKTDATLQTV
jgi:hypothetical protein